jgi:chemosensory pili system protein ChpB (putative protein-glutamate methylesterase)
VRNTQSNVAVALLYQTQELGRHMREALSSLGTPIVYEAATDHLDPGALEESGARVVVVNLDPAVEAHLDEVYGLLEDDRYSVVFNDAQVSSGLSGWDQARWVRHLAAKILGDVDIDPPRPEGAESIPAPPPATLAAEVADEPDALEAEEMEIESAPASSYADEVRRIVEDTQDDPGVGSVEKKAGDPLDMLESRYDEMNQPAESAFPSPPPPPAEEFDFSTLEALTATPAAPIEPVSPMLTLADEFRDDEASIAAGQSAATTETEPVEEGDAFDLAALDALFGDAPVNQVDDADAIDVGDLGDMGTIESTGAPERAANDADDDDVDDDEVVAPSFSLVEEISFDAPPVTAVPKEIASSATPPKLAAAADWSLEDMLDGEPAPPPPPSGPAVFGVEKLSAAEYLAPPTEGTAPPSIPESDFAFELMPLEEAVAPQQVEREAHEVWLDPDLVKAPAAKIRRVWVLGASIGGPEAVREFLGGLPRDYPALFVLAQHMGAEFVDLMAQQLAKSTALTVRTPTHGERVGHGEVVLVPTTHRLQVDPEGIVVLERSGNDAAYSPSIDRVLRDVADRYGANAGAIIFSGMTTDAVEGSTYLAGKGGTVYAQHPDTCVVSSMVDGAVEAGIVKFLGSPKELTERLLTESAGNKR